MGIESLNSSPAIPMDNTPSMKSIEGEVQEIVSEIAPLFRSDSNLSVGSTRRTEEGDEVPDTEDVDQLDPADLEKINANNVDLEALIAKLQAETDKAQLESAMERIDSLKCQMSASHANTMTKVLESIDAIYEQEKSAKLQKALGWLGVVMAFAMVAITVCTGGSTAAIALAVIGAVLATVNLALTDTGVMDDLINWMADMVQQNAERLAEAAGESSGMTREEAEARAEIAVAIVEAVIAVVMIAVGAVAGGGGAISKGAKIAMIVAGATMAAAGIAAGGYATYANYEAAMAQGDVTEDKAIMKKHQAMLDQESEALKQLLQQLSDSMGAIFELLDAKQKMLNVALMNIGA